LLAAIIASRKVHPPESEVHPPESVVSAVLFTKKIPACAGLASTTITTLAARTA
jgi:hypothetical protein